MKNYGTFEPRSRGDGIIYFVCTKGKNRGSDFYDMQAHDLHIEEGQVPFFDQPYYMAVDAKGQLVSHNADISHIVPAKDRSSTLYGGDLTIPEEVADNPLDWRWTKQGFVSALTSDQRHARAVKAVNAECDRRICNLLGVRTKTEALAKQISGVCDTQKDQIQAIVAASNDLTDLPEIPNDFRDDRYWSSLGEGQ